MKASLCRERGLFLIANKLVSVITLIFFSAGTVFALPAGQQVVNGQASFITQSNNLMITSSPNAIINWQGFSINNNEAVRFIQQYSTSSVLNRVIGQDPSRILGLLQSNGRVFLINPNGILFGQGARIDVNGLFASTLAISNQDFLAGKFNFSAGAGAGSIQNQGTITTPEGGKVYLIAPDIENSGIINSPQGEVLLAAGHSVQLVDSLNPDIAVVVSAPDNKAVNLGQIVAQSGKVGIYGGLISQKGIVNADSAVVGENGRIFFKASKDVTLDQGSTVSAKGGNIQILGGMESGTAKVSGTIDASAPNGGDGGFIETSAAHVKVDDSARITTLAPYGRAGRWLLDPYDFTIAASGGDITGTALSTALGGNSVTIQTLAGSVSCTGATCGTGTSTGNGDIFVNDAVSWSANSLTLSAYRNINVNSTLNGSGTAQLALLYGQGSANGSIGDVPVASTYSVKAPVNLPAGPNFSTKLGSDGTPVNFTVITNLGVEGDAIGGTDQTLQGMARTANLASNYTLGSDIPASATFTWNLGAGFTPIGNLGIAHFTGTFDGLGHTITGLTINRPATNYVGLFGYTDNATIRNVGLVNVYVVGNRSVGGLAGANYIGSISNSYTTGTVRGNADYVGGLAGDYNGSISSSYSSATVSSGTGDSVGGLVGWNYGGTISNSHATGAVSGADSIGGLVGCKYDSSITDSYSTGDVNGSVSNIGGLVGYNLSGAISGSFSTGNVGYTGDGTGSYSMGGLVGYNSDGTISNSYATGTVIGGGSGTYYYCIGGLIGENYGSIINSYSTGAVSRTGTGIGNYSVGGLIGYNYGTISSSHSAGVVSASGTGDDYHYVGGLVGENYADISDSYSIGAVSGVDNVGGLVGYNAATITNSYSTGAVTGSSNVGGLLGWNNGGTISSSYWDTDTSGQATSAGGTGLTTAQMMTPASYTGWDFSETGTWWMSGTNNTRPFLRSEYSTNIANAHQLQLMGMNATTLAASYTLAGDIDMSELTKASGLWNTTAGFLPVGDSTTNFTGTFDGLGHTITDLYINRPTTGPVSLFGYTGSVAAIRNVGLVNGNITGQASVSGLVGYNTGNISNSYSTGAVIGTGFGGTYIYDVGGLVGYNSSSGTITNSYSTGAVTGNSSVGGLVGYNGGTITNSYSTGTVIGTGNYVGGLVGYNEGNISNSYSTGAVSGITNVGGLLGWYGGGTITSSYWDIDTSGQPTSGGGMGTGKTTSDMMTTGTGTFAGWDFTNTWWMSDTNTRPFLRTEYSTNITNAHQLQLMGMNMTTLAASYTLAGDIDMSELTQASGLWNTTTKFLPVGDSDYPFTGTFDGLGHTITGLSINRTTDYIGLFGYSTGVVRNVGIVNGNITGNAWVGALVGYNDNTGIITNSSSTGTGMVTGTGSAVGGLVGYNNGTITNSYNTRAVTGTTYVGGLVGDNYDSGTISNSYNSGTVYGSGNYIGGLAGENYWKIINSYSAGNVAGTGTSDGVGGLVGWNVNWGNPSISNSYSTGTVTGGTNVGGLVGIGDSSTITNSYWDTQTSGIADPTPNPSTYGTGKTTSDMMTTTTGTFTGWGFGTIWRIYEGHTAPLLKSFLTPLTITADNVTKMYDGTSAGLTNASYSDPAAPTSGNLFGVTTPYGSTKNNVGSYSPDLWSNQKGYDITVGTGPGTYGTLTVTPYAVSMTGNRTYDGTADLAAGIFTLGPLVTTPSFYETLTLTGTGTLADKNVGTGKTVNVSGLTLGNGYSGGVGPPPIFIAGLASNYTFTGGTQTVDITPAPLTVTATGVSKVYDGLTGATVTLADNRVAGDILTTAYTNAAYLDKNVAAEKTVNVSGITLTNADAGNYTFNTTALTTADITARGLNISATGVNKVYDGLTGATVTLADNRVAGDNLITAYASATFLNKNVAAGKPVNVSGITLASTDAGNYTFNTTALTTADITARALNVTATGVNKVYDGLTGATVTLADNRVAGDSLTTAYASAAYLDKNVATDKTVNVSGITLASADAGNYTFNTTAATTADITARALTITAATNTKGYDGNTSAAALPTITGLAGTDTATSSEAYDSKIAGTGKTLTPAAAVISDGNGGNNYLVTYVPNTTGVIEPGQIVSGMLDVAAGGKTIYFVVNGTLLSDSASTTESGNYSGMLPLIPNNSALLAYVYNDSSVKSASVYLSTGGDITDLLLSSNTVTAGGGGTMSNATFGTAKGALSSSDIPYSVSGTNLTLSPNFNFKTASGTTYKIDGNITTTNGAHTYNGPVTLLGNAVLSAGTGNISFGGAVTGTGYNFTLNSQGTVTQTAPISVSGLELLGTGGTYNLTDAGNAVTTLAGNTGTVNFTNSTGLSIDTVNTTTGMTTSGSVALNATGAIGLNGDVLAAGGIEIHAGGDGDVRQYAGNIANTIAGSTTPGGYDINISGHDVNLRSVASQRDIDVTAQSLTVGNVQALGLQGFHVDDEYFTYLLPFSFSFYGTPYTTAYISSNGIITFGSGTSAYTDSTSSLQNYKIIASAWNDWDTRDNSNFTRPLDVYVSSAAGALGVRWDVARYPRTSQSAQFETVLYNNGNIKFNYGPANYSFSGDVTIGLSNQSSASTLASQLMSQPNFSMNNLQSTTFSYASEAGQYSETLSTGSDWNASMTGSGTSSITSLGNITLNSAAGIAINGAVNAGSNKLKLVGAGTVSQMAPITAAGLELLGAGATYNLTHTDNAITTLAGNTGTVNFTNSTGLGIGTVNTAGLATSGDLTLNSGGAITQSAPLQVVGVATFGAGATNDITLANAENSFSSVGITSGKDVSLTNTGALVLNASTASNNLSVTAGGDITLNGLVTATGAGTEAGTGGNVTLHSGGAIINGMGSSTSISAGSLFAEAVNGIGSGDPLMTGVNNVTALNTTANNIEIDNTGVLTVSDLKNLGTGNVILQNIGGITTETSPVTASGGSVSMTAHSPLTIGSGGVSAYGSISLEASSSEGGSDNLTINGSIASANGSIILTAGSDIVLGPGGTLSAPNGTITLNGTSSTGAGDLAVTGNETATDNTVSSLEKGDDEDERRKKIRERGEQTSDDKKTDDVKKYCN